MRHTSRWPLRLMAMPMLIVLAIPALALVFGTTGADLADGLAHPDFAQALWTSAATSAISLSIVVIAGSPLAWWLATARGRGVRAVELVVDLPIVMPPAVIGLGLLLAFGRGGPLGDQLGQWGVDVVFTSAAVVLAQVIVSAPFYIQSAAAAFRRVEPDLLLVGRTLGLTARQVVWRVAIPMALPGLIGGAALAWARALGEFGATLLFAGNFAGTTRTMPLAILTALESDVRIAVALALALAGASALLLWGLRRVPAVVGRAGRT